jgi:hypothetical protein
MSIEDASTMRVIVTSIAGGVVIFVTFALIRSIIFGGKRAVWEIVRVIAGLISMLLVGLSSRGNIGPWGAWAGVGCASVLLLTTLAVSCSDRNLGRRNRPMR